MNKKEIKVPLEVTLIYDRERLEEMCGMGFINVADSNSNKDIVKKSSYFFSSEDKLVKLKVSNTGFSIRLKDCSPEFEYYSGDMVISLEIDHPDFDENFKENNKNLKIRIFLENYLRILKTTSSVNGDIEEKFSLALVKGFPEIYELVCENQVENLQEHMRKAKLLKESKKTSKWIFGHKYLLEDNKEYLYLGKIHLFSDTYSSSFNTRIANIHFSLYFYTNIGKSGNLLLELTEELKLLLQTVDSDFSLVLERIYEEFNEYTIPIKFRKNLPSGVDLGEVITNNFNASFDDIRNRILVSKIDNSSIKDMDELYKLQAIVDSLLTLSDTGTLNFPKNVSDKIIQFYEDSVVSRYKQTNCSSSTPIGSIVSYCGINYTGTINYFKDIFSIDIIKRSQDIIENLRNPKP